MVITILQRFQNPSRPNIVHAEVDNIPVDQVYSGLSGKILDSLEINSDIDWACAEAARLWEEALELHPEAPYLLLKVADMRFALDSPVMANILYEQTQHIRYGHTISKMRSLGKPDKNEMHAYKTSQDYVGGRRWVPAKEYYGEFPIARVPNELLQGLHRQWSSAILQGDIALQKFMNIHCIETNVLEGTVVFSPSFTTKLIHVGFYDYTLGITDSDIIGGAVTTSQDAISILQDTNNALKDILSLKEEPITLTIDFLCGLHRTMMKSSRVLCVNGQHGKYLKYVAVGVTRKTTRSNVLINTSGGGKVQFCPYDELDKELQFFCDRFNELMRTPDIDPFAAAAWINHVFVAIHPFEDGNGRLSRILSSLPLIKNNLPPLCIRASTKSTYINSLTEIRRDFGKADYQNLITYFFEETTESLKYLEALPLM